jgi:ribose transport system permease protein
MRPVETTEPPAPATQPAATRVYRAVGDGLRRQLQQILAFTSLIVLVIFFSFASSNFLTWSNISGILLSTAVIGILALGTTFVIITAGIELSLGTGMTLGHRSGLRPIRPPPKHA